MSFDKLFSSEKYMQNLLQSQNLALLYNIRPIKTELNYQLVLPHIKQQMQSLNAQKKRVTNAKMDFSYKINLSQEKLNLMKLMQLNEQKMKLEKFNQQSRNRQIMENYSPDQQKRSKTFDIRSISLQHSDALKAKRIKVLNTQLHSHYLQQLQQNQVQPSENHAASQRKLTSQPKKGNAHFKDGQFILPNDILPWVSSDITHNIFTDLDIALNSQAEKQCPPNIF